MNKYHLDRTKFLFGLVADSQEEKGIKKYGKPLEPSDNYDWLKMALEEQVDGTKYLVAEMEKRKLVRLQILEIVAKNCDIQTYLEVKRLLLSLEGKL